MSHAPPVGLPGGLVGALGWAATYYAEDGPLWRAGGWEARRAEDGIRCTRGDKIVIRRVVGIDMEKLK
jgi:hypothetical protein